MTESRTTAPCTTRLDLDAGGYRPLLEGPPATAGMRSGFVTLAPGKSVGQHSTGRHEEVLVVLSGSGRMSFGGHPSADLVAPCAAYCPPDTEHDVTNTSSEPLRYVYVVAPVAR